VWGRSKEQQAEWEGRKSSKQGDGRARKKRKEYTHIHYPEAFVVSVDGDVAVVVGDEDGG
jgi:hypothetical protein